MTRFVGAGEAARLLGVQKATLYAYVSRGLIDRRVAVDGRTSLYAVDDVEALAGRVRRREVEPRPSLDVQIVTGVTTLDEAGVTLPRPRRRRAVPDVHVRAGGRAALDRRSCRRPRRGPAPSGRRPAGRRRDRGRSVRTTCRHDGRRRRRPRRAAPHRRSGHGRPPVARRGAGRAAASACERIPATGRSAARLAAAWHPDPTARARRRARPGPRAARRPRAGHVDAGRARRRLDVARAVPGVRRRAGDDRRAVPRRRRGPGRTSCSSSASGSAGRRRSSCGGCRLARSCPASVTRSTSATTPGWPRCSRSSRSCPTRTAASTSSTTCSPRPGCG